MDPKTLRYAPTHEWVSLDGDIATIGISQFAVDQLTDVTYVEVKKPGFKFKPGDAVGEVESVKTTSDVYCACEGEISEVNKAVVDDPSLLNSDPFGKGWLVKIKVTAPGKLGECVDAATYDRQHT